VKASFNPPKNPQALLTHAVGLLAAYANQLSPEEQRPLREAQSLLGHGQMPARDTVLALQQAYLRLKAGHEALLAAIEEQMMWLAPREAQLAQIARGRLDGGQLLPLDLLGPLHAIYRRIMLPQVLERLEAQATLLTDEENDLVRRARMELDMGALVNEQLQSAVFQVQHAFAARQYIF
jgi:hypothetical protein